MNIEDKNQEKEFATTMYEDVKGHTMAKRIINDPGFVHNTRIQATQ